MGKMTITKIENDPDPLLDFLIDSYLINEQELGKEIDKIESLVSKLRGYGIKLPFIKDGCDVV